MTNQDETPCPVMDTGTRLAYTRTFLAMENTMMSWIRTATSLITFGFAFYKFFEIELKGQIKEAQWTITPRTFGLLMICIGLVSLLLATVQHVMALRRIRAQWHEAPRSTTAILAGLIAILGLVALIGSALRQ